MAKACDFRRCGKVLTKNELISFDIGNRQIICCSDCKKNFDEELKLIFFEEETIQVNQFPTINNPQKQFTLLGSTIGYQPPPYQLNPGFQGLTANAYNYPPGSIIISNAEPPPIGSVFKMDVGDIAFSNSNGVSVGLAGILAGAKK